jgi:predicted 3-demethylubiquinone-9 3-methyltransferase (glyoxalase superfamily)
MPRWREEAGIGRISEERVNHAVRSELPRNVEVSRFLAKELAQDGQVLMGLDNYGFSRLFTWVNDRFGVSWQLNLE